MVEQDYIKFLGTAGARFVMIKQLRSSAGIWLSSKGVNVLIDPGPGSLIRALNSRPKLNPEELDAVILTHKHLDHSNDVNLMIEAMTGGGFKHRGSLFAPKDCFGNKGVVFDYAAKLVPRIEYLDKGNFEIKGFRFEVPEKMIHPVLTFGLKFSLGNKTVSLISDTAFFEELKTLYRADVLIINVVFYEKREGIAHLCLGEAKKIISAVKPELAVLTHFGMTMLRAKPHKIEKELTAELGVEVKCAYDGMRLGANLDIIHKDRGQKS